MKNCKTFQSWMPDYGDGTLSAEQNERLKAHLDTCDTCAEIVREMAAVHQLLRGLVPLQTSAQFDAKLAARLAQAQNPPARVGWLPQLGPAFMPPLLRPALALGAATCVLAGALLLYAPSAPVAPSPPADDAAFISQCVALHQRDVAAQPLTNPAASGVAAAQSAWSGDTTQENL